MARRPARGRRLEPVIHRDQLTSDTPRQARTCRPGSARPWGSSACRSSGRPGTSASRACRGRPLRSGYPAGSRRAFPRESGHGDHGHARRKADEVREAAKPTYAGDEPKIRKTLKRRLAAEIAASLLAGPLAFVLRAGGPRPPRRQNGGSESGAAAGPAASASARRGCGRGRRGAARSCHHAGAPRASAMTASAPASSGEATLPSASTRTAIGVPASPTPTRLVVTSACPCSRRGSPWCPRPPGCRGRASGR